MSEFFKKIAKSILYTIFWERRKKFILRNCLSGKSLGKLDTVLLNYYNSLNLKKAATDHDYDPSAKWAGESGDSFWALKEHNFSLEMYVDDEVYRKPFLQAILAVQATRNIKRIIEFGCGPGNNLKWLKIRNPDCVYLGIDVNRGVIEGAKKNFEDILFIEGDVLKLIRSNLYLDSSSLIFCSAVLMYFNSYNIRALLEHVPLGGFFAINEPFIDEVSSVTCSLPHSLSSFFHNYELIFKEVGFDLVSKSVRDSHNHVKIASMIFIKIK
jgi:SAM-dependent methyltransferase